MQSSHGGTIVEQSREMSRTISEGFDFSEDKFETTVIRQGGVIYLELL